MVAVREGADPDARRPGRTPAASRAQVLAAARARFLACARLDVVALAAELGLGRVTVYRWFGSREGLLTAVLAAEAEQVFAQAVRHAPGRGASRLLAVFDGVNRALAGSPALRHLLRTEPDVGRRLVLSSASPVRPTVLRLLEAVVEEEVAAGRYAPAVDTATLAVAVERLAVAFLYEDERVDVRGDVERLRAVEAALLGLPAGTGPGPLSGPGSGSPG